MVGVVSLKIELTWRTGTLYGAKQDGTVPLLDRAELRYFTASPAHQNDRAAFPTCFRSVSSARRAREAVGPDHLRPESHGADANSNWGLDESKAFRCCLVII